jgi:hypothetical protein
MAEYAYEYIKIDVPDGIAWVAVLNRTAIDVL